MKPEPDIQKAVEHLGELVFQRLTSDPEIDAMVQHIKDRGMILSFIIEANPDPMDQDQLSLTTFDRQFLQKLHIRVTEDIHENDTDGSLPE